eukprot:GFUD01015788.1.p1 GENE.GFUD01015788.1~~GFUD01015788.1.p1  ORF type:complete len:490 (+),score=133.83 GFUD01015788.1:100-1569(+)
MADQTDGISAGPCGRFRFTEYPDVRVGLIHLDRKRPWPSCVNPETGNQWADDVKEKMVEILNKSGRQVFRSDGEVKVDDDPTLRQAVALCNQKGVDVLVAIQPTISDGRLAPVLAQQWGKGLVFWASPEEQTGEMISGNSLVGSHLMTATLRQLGRPCEFVYNNLDWDTAAVRLEQAVNLGFASRFVQNTKIALIGHQAPGFVDFHPNPFLLSQTFGSILQHVGLTEYTTTALEGITDEEVQKDVDHVLNELKLPFKALETGFGVEKKDLPAASRHYLAMKKLVVTNNFDALAIRCWPELPGPHGLGQWAYMALARLATEGFPVACEGDVDGAFSCMVGKLLGCGAVYLSDWLEHDKNTLTLWHGGMAPFQLSEAVGTPLGPCISRHFNNKVPGCLDATIKIGLDVTVFRFWVMNNKYHLLVLEGQTIKPKRHLLGNNGLVEFSPPVDLVEGFDRWLEKGFPHHVCVVQGKQKKILAKFARDHGVLVLE